MTILRWCLMVGLLVAGSVHAATVSQSGSTITVTLGSSDQLQVSNPGTDQLSFNLTAGNFTAVTAPGFNGAGTSTSTGTLTSVVSLSIVDGAPPGAAETVDFGSWNRMGSLISAMPITVNMGTDPGDDVSVSDTIDQSTVAAGTTAFQVINAYNVSIPGSLGFTSGSVIINCARNINLTFACIQLNGPGALVNLTAAGNIIGDDDTTTADIFNGNGGGISMTASVGPAVNTTITIVNADSSGVPDGTLNIHNTGTGDVNVALATGAVPQAGSTLRWTKVFPT